MKNEETVKRATKVVSDWYRGLVVSLKDRPSGMGELMLRAEHGVGNLTFAIETPAMLQTARGLMAAGRAVLVNVAQKSSDGSGGTRVVLEILDALKYAKEVGASVSGIPVPPKVKTKAKKASVEPGLPSEVARAAIEFGSEVSLPNGADHAS